MEGVLIRGLVGVLGALPRGLSRRIGTLVGKLAYLTLKKLRGVGFQNLDLAFPNLARVNRRKLLKSSFEQLGRQLAEFCQMRHYTPEQISTFIRYEGLDRYKAAVAKGKGVFVLTGHLGAWELSSFFHSLMGFPMGMVIRRLDNAIAG